jgi:FKBP-type peptidyl-prolyl cis-trans isomerase 2
MEKVKQGDRVSVHYSGYLEDGSLFGTSRTGAPLVFTVGSDEVIVGLSGELVGMVPGESKSFVVSPEKAYGRRDDKLRVRVPRDLIPADAEPHSPIRTELNGRSVVLWLDQYDGDSAVLDANHPLAGRVLKFDVELIAIES